MSSDNKREANVTTTTKVTTVITVRINNHGQQAQRDCQRQLLSLTVTIFYFKILSNTNATLVVRTLVRTRHVCFLIDFIFIKSMTVIIFKMKKIKR